MRQLNTNSGKKVMKSLCPNIASTFLITRFQNSFLYLFAKDSCYFQERPWVFSATSYPKVVTPHMEQNSGQIFPRQNTAQMFIRMGVMSLPVKCKQEDMFTPNKHTILLCQNKLNETPSQSTQDITPNVSVPFKKPQKH